MTEAQTEIEGAKTPPKPQSKPRKRAVRQSLFRKQMTRASRGAKKAGTNVGLAQLAMFTAKSPHTMPVEPGVQKSERIPMDLVFKPEGFNSRRELWGPPEKGEDLETLAASIREHGLIEPIVVVRQNFAPKGKPEEWRYALIVGERRWAALGHLKATHVSAVILDVSLAEALRVNRIENAHRKDLASWEIAMACVDARERKDARKKTAADLNISASTISNYLAIVDMLTTCPAAWESYKTGVLKTHTALELRGVARKLAKERSIELAAAFAEVWANFTHETPPAKGKRTPGKQKPTKPTKRTLVEFEETLETALSRKAKMNKAQRPWVAGALFILKWQRGEVVEKNINRAVHKELVAALARAEVTK